MKTPRQIYYLLRARKLSRWLDILHRDQRRLGLVFAPDFVAQQLLEALRRAGD